MSVVSDTAPNPSGLCMCGCGAPTPIARKTQRSENKLRGYPTRYLPGHHGVRQSRVEYVIDATTGCWEWQLGKNNRGYGMTCVAGKRCLAHRAMYECFKGPIPAGLQIDHLCRNKGCINPAHLEAVTHRENLNRGNSTKLTDAQVCEIRASELTASVLADRFGVTRNYISDLRASRRRIGEVGA